MIKCGRYLLKLTIGIAAAAAASADATACSHTYSLAQTLRMERAEPVTGSFLLEKEPDHRPGTLDELIRGVEVSGIVVSVSGQRLRVRYRLGGLECISVKLPNRDATGVFYVKRTQDNEYELIHWKQSGSFDGRP